MGDKIAKAGKLLCVDQGEYSDYDVTGFFVVLKDFEPLLELTKYLGDRPKQKERYSFDSSEFMAYLLAQGLLLEIQYGTLHLADYGSPSEVSFTPAGDA